MIKFSNGGCLGVEEIRKRSKKFTLKKQRVQLLYLLYFASRCLNRNTCYAILYIYIKLHLKKKFPKSIITLSSLIYFELNNFK